MIKRFLIAFVLLAVVCGGLVYFNIFRNQAIEDFFANQVPPAVPVSTVVAEAGVWQPGIEAIGTVRAGRGVDLAVEASGRIIEVTFESNEEVEEGALLVQIDDDVEEASLAAARSNVSLAEQTLQRAQELRTRGVSAEATLEEAQADAESARAEVARLEAVLSQKALRAPFSGTLGIPEIEAGQYVAAGTAVATLQDLDTMRVDFSVPEQQLPLLQIGQDIRLGSEEGELAYSGTITGIEPRIDPNSRLVAVRAEVDNRDQQLNPGQFARVRVILPEEDGVIALPQTAVTASLYGDYVYVVREAENEEAAAARDAAEAAEESPQAPPPPEGSQEGPILEAAQVFVETGRSNAGRIEIVEGVSPGDRVVATGQNRLSNGSLVTLSETPTPIDIETSDQVSAR